MDSSSLIPRLAKALSARTEFFDPSHESAFRVFNGFLEGCPQLAIDLYGSTLLFHNHAAAADEGKALVQEALEFLSNHPLFAGWLRAAVVKDRESPIQERRRGVLLSGSKPDTRIKEHETWYALDLLLNRDASLYLDTRELRKWISASSSGKRMLNAFAYTGSLGVAAMAGGAERVVQLDRSRVFLNLAKTSYTMNGFPIHKPDFMAADFFTAVAKLRRSNELFDLVIIDPPFFSSTPGGRVDQLHESARLINKVRPLIHDGGILVAINNALYLSGAEYMRTLEALCTDGYLGIRELIPVPRDFTDYPQTRVGQPVTDPAPFNHSTKIAILDVKRKPQPPTR
jgi:23S rRNA (cytosine1962-C5)-methyltransferase